MAPPARGSTCVHITAAVALHISSASMTPEREKPNCIRSEAGSAGLFRAERGQIQHILKRSSEEHQEHVQPGRMKMPKGTQRLGTHGPKISSNASELQTSSSFGVPCSEAHFLHARALTLRLTAQFLYLLSQKTFRWHVSKDWKILLFLFYGLSHKKPRARVFFTQYWIRP